MNAPVWIWHKYNRNDTAISQDIDQCLTLWMHSTYWPVSSKWLSFIYSSYCAPPPCIFRLQPRPPRTQRSQLRRCKIRRKHRCKHRRKHWCKHRREPRRKLRRRKLRRRKLRRKLRRKHLCKHRRKPRRNHLPKHRCKPRRKHLRNKF